jgi:hypothetical protein
MTSNNDDIRRMVESARQVDADQRQAKQNAAQEASDQAGRQKAAVLALRERIDAKFKSVAAASDGAMAYAGPVTSESGAADYQLTWNLPEPQRGVSVEVNSETGTVQWAWITSAATKRRNSLDAGNVSERQLDQLIKGLADQASWSKGTPPLVLP